MSNHLHFVQSIDPLFGGGLGTAAMGLSSAMRQVGLNSELVATVESKEHPIIDGVHTYKRTGPRPLYFSTGMWRSASELVEHSDFVHAHGLHVFPNALFGALAKSKSKQLVIHAHGFFDPWILQRSKAKKKLAYLLFERRNFLYAKYWRALTGKESDQIVAAFPHASGKTIVVPNGISLASVDSAVAKYGNSPFSPQHKTIFLMSRLHPKKGIQLFLNVWSRLYSEWPDWRVVIAGPDEGGFASKLLAQTRAHDMCSSVEFVGPIVGPRRFSYFAHADIFALPSYSEGFPMTLVESSACGVPAIFTDQCNFPELASSGGGWECLPSEDSLAEALRRALQCSSAERLQRGQNARKLVEARYTSEVVVNQLVAALQA